MLLPPRHWFQFRLTTWFVMVAILAWAMLLGPTVAKDFHDWQRRTEMIAFVNNPDSPLVYWSTRDDWQLYWDVLDERAGRTSGTSRAQWRAHLLYPALALAAFIGWKAAWAVGRRVGRISE